MPTLNYHIHAYGDLEQAKQAIKSLPTNTPIHIFDGRYATFDGDTDLTPGLREFCAKHPDTQYHAPPPEQLPFGHTVDAPPEYRPGVHAKTQWAFTQLPPTEWTLKLDTDERLRTVDVDLNELNPNGKYAPVVHRHGDPAGDGHITRLFKPECWTPWLDDTFLPREVFPRDHPLEKLATAWLNREFRAVWHLRRGHVTGIVIDNYGAERPAEYQRRRVSQLEGMGRTRRANDVSGMVND